MTTTKAVSPNGNTYIKTRTIGDATVTVIEFDERTRDNGKVYWASSTLEVTAGKKKATIHTENGRLRVPSAPELKNPTIRQAIDAALGRKKGTLPEPVRNAAPARGTPSSPAPAAGRSTGRRSAPVPADLLERMTATLSQNEAARMAADAADRQGLDAKPSTRRTRSSAKAGK
jgi:hypothetical protein